MNRDDALQREFERVEERRRSELEDPSVCADPDVDPLDDGEYDEMAERRYWAQLTEESE